MRVLQIITRSELRGAEVFSAQLADELVRRGHVVEVAALYSPPADPSQLLRLQAAKLRQLDGRVKGRIEPRTITRLVRSMREFRPDLVQANAFHALKYAALVKRCFGFHWPLVYRNISLASGWIQRPFQQTWGRWLFRAVDRVASVSDASAEDLVATYGMSRPHVTTIRRGIHLDSLISREAAYDRLTTLLTFAPSRPLLFHVGGFTAEKNHAGLLASFQAIVARYPSARLVLLGDGPLRSEVEQRIRVSSFRDQVHLLGARADARELLAAADLLLLPSLIEGIPGVVLEAAARKVPAVCTRVGGIAEAIVHDETGSLVPPGDPSRFASEACRLLGDEGERHRMGAAAEALIRKLHSLNHVVSEFETLYSSLISDVSAPKAVVCDLDSSRE